MRRLDLYVFKEILGPLLLGFLVYTFILLLQTLFKSAELIIRSDVAVGTVGRLLWLSLPNIVVLTIPMALLFAILIAIGRLSGDSELTAIRASGVSMFSLYRPILLLSAILAGLNAHLMLEVLPKGNRSLQQLRIEILTQGLTQEVQPRIPHTGWQNQTLYIFESPVDEDRWRGVFLADISMGGEDRIDIAEWGEAQPDPEDASLVTLQLTDAFTHQFDLRDPAKYNIIGHSEIDLVLTAENTQRQAVSVKRSLRELPLRHLKARAANPEEPELVRRLAQVEIHKKFSIPTACLVFGLLALPLGFTRGARSGGRSSGFAVSIGIILVYYILLSLGEDLAKKGSLPPAPAVWFSNATLLVIGIFLLARRNRDKSLLLASFDQWIQEHAWGKFLRFKEEREKKKKDALKKRRAQSRRSRRRKRRDSDLVLKLPSLQLRFPNAIDRYVLATFLRVLLITTLAGVTVYIVADITENADEILRNNPPTEVVFDYYKLKVLSIVYEIAPILVLIATLISFGLLSGSNEVTAFKALGMSLYRISLPVILSGVVVAGVCALLEAEVLAASNSEAARLKAEIRGRDGSVLYQSADRRWLHGRNDGFLYNFDGFDPAKKELTKLQVFQFDREYRLERRLYVDRATYAGDGWWTFSSGWARTFEGSTVTEFVPFDEPRREVLPEEPEFFAALPPNPEEMGYGELKEYIAELKAIGGRDTPILEVELHKKIAYPTISFVMTLVALPFAFRLGRQGGALYGIGLSLVLGIALMIVLAFFSALGEAAILPPLIAVWTPNAIFAIFSLYLFLGVRT